jgi:adenylate cyclase
VDKPISSDVLLFDGFRLDCRGGVLYRSGEGPAGAPVELGARGVALLSLLAGRQGRVVAKEEIMKAVWPGRIVEDANLNVQISKLRQILDRDRTEGSCIQTVPGRGYCFVSPVNRLVAAAQPLLSASTEAEAPQRQRFSVVVLPFENLSPDADQRYFADAITDDLTTNLSRYTDMLVISRNTAFTYRDRPRDTRQIGSELNVRYVLEGSVRRVGERVRINAQLIDAETDAHMWAEMFDHRLSDLFELQDEITTAIVGAIEPQLLKAERDRIALRPVGSEDAYEAYQRGLWRFYRYTKEDSIEAEVLFRRALAMDARYAQPAAQLAMTLCNAAYLGWSDNAEHNYAEAFELAERAVSLDARLPTAHFALGLVSMWTHRSDRAISSFQQAIDLNPSYAAAHVLLGQMRLYCGEPERALALVERGIRLSPKDSRLFIWLSALAGAHYQLRQYEKAIDAGRRSWTLNRTWPFGLRYVVAGLAQLGRAEEAKGALEDLKRLDPDVAFVEANLRRLYDDRTAIDHILDGLRAAGFN